MYIYINSNRLRENSLPVLSLRTAKLSKVGLLAPGHRSASGDAGWNCPAPALPGPVHSSVLSLSASWNSLHTKSSPWLPFSLYWELQVLKSAPQFIAASYQRRPSFSWLWCPSRSCCSLTPLTLLHRLVWLLPISWALGS